MFVCVLAFACVCVRLELRMCLYVVFVVCCVVLHSLCMCSRCFVCPCVCLRVLLNCVLYVMDCVVLYGLFVLCVIYGGSV